MNNSNLRKALEASQFYYARMYEAMRPEHERTRMEQKQILGGLYREVAEMEARLRAIEEELGYKHSPRAHKFNPYHDDLGRFASGPGGGDANDSGNSGTGADNSKPPSVLPKVSVPGPNGQPVNQANIFVGGAMDQSGFHNVEDSASLNNATYGDNYYATHTDLDKIDQQISQLPDGQTVNLVGHSWGGETAAQAAVDNPGRINTLVTVDPVGYDHPDYATIGKSVNTWVNVNATGNPDSSVFGDITNGNLAAGVGGAWNNGPNGHADVLISAPYNHADFNQMMNYPSANGGPSAQQILNGKK